MDFPRLFEPGKIGALEIGNRIYMSPMVNRIADETGYVTRQMIDFYAARAKGGVGFISCQSVNILEEARDPGRLSVYDDKFIPGLRELSDAVHAYGARIALQVVHRGMLSEGSLESGQLLSPSPVNLTGLVPISEGMSQEDIDRVITGFAEAASRIKEAGFDAVEIHGAHGRLIGEFLSPLWNRRRDGYGGSTRKRARFACEVISAMREKVGKEFPIIFRLSGSDFIEGSSTLEHALIQAPLFVQAGADALHVSASSIGSTQWVFPSYLQPEGVLLGLAEAVRKAVNVPVIAVGRLGNPVIAEKALREGKADFIALGRALFADPELPIKVKQGRIEDINYCIYCNNCIRKDPQASVKHVRCTVNPYLCREGESGYKEAARKKKVVVIGGGLAGMEAARVMAERGHQVSLYEKEDKLGGQWNAASVRERDESGNFFKLAERMVLGLKKAGVAVHLNKEADAALIRGANPDAVIIATGAVPRIPRVPGIKGRNVVTAVDVLSGKSSAGKSVVVVGGSHTGLEVAHILANKGKVVSVVDQVELGWGVQREIFLYLRDKLTEKGVQFFRFSPLIRVLDNGVYINFQDAPLFLEADTVVLATGVKSENVLEKEIRGMVKEVGVIGDASSPRDAREAIQEGAEIGRRI